MIELILERITPADPVTGWVMTEHYAIVEKASGQTVGTIRLRLGNTDDIRLYAGNIGYPDNWPSRRTCERIGAALVEIIDLPEELDMYQDGERQKCRYLWQLNK